MALIDENTWSTILAHEDTELLPPADAASIEAFETEQGFRLPDVHREFLLRGNGGVIGYARLFGIGGDDALDLGQQLSAMRSYIQESADGPVFPFANDWGGSYFCYDLRKPGGPKGDPVLFWNHELSEEPDDRPMLWSEYAPDFVAFVKEVIDF